MVIAESLDRAKEFIAANAKAEYRGIASPMLAEGENPDFECEVIGPAPQMFIFPDAGCC